MRRKDETWKLVVVLFLIFMAMVFTVMEMSKNAQKVGETTEATPSETTVSCTLSTTDIATTILTTENSASGTTTSSTSAQTTFETTSVTEPVTEAPVTEPVTNAVEEKQPETQAIIEDEKPAEEVKPEPQPEPEPVEEFLVYKPSTYYIHKNTCRWNSGDAYRVDDVTGLEARLCTECCPVCDGYTEYIPPVEETPSSDGMTYVKHFTRGTYYCYGCEKYGGSGRYLYDCSYGNGNGIKGSIASSYIYSNYGYNYNGERTKVYIEVAGYPSMSGFYYCDDSDAGNWNVIDFFYIYGSNCPFQNQGVVEVDVWI